MFDGIYGLGQPYNNFETKYPKLQDKLITVVMPTYCQSRFILEAVESVLSQTYGNLELIIVDDGSTDNTQDIINQIKDKRVRILTKKNGGTGSALNLGFVYSKGKYETWIASDNKMYPECLEKLSVILNLYSNIGFVYGNFDFYYDDTKQLIDSADINKDKMWNKQRLYKEYYLGIAFLWRRELRKKVGRFWQHPCEDYDFALRMSCIADFMYFPSKPLAVHRVHDRSLTQKLINKDKNWPFVCRENALKKVIYKFKQESYEKTKHNEIAEIFI